MTKSQVADVRRSRGSAMTEAIIAMLALLPALAAVVHLGRVQDIQSSAVEGARYLTWERTLWQRSGDVSKSDAELRREMRDRIFGSDRAGLLSHSDIQSRGIAVNPIWRDSSGDTLLHGSSESGGITAINTDSGATVAGNTGPTMRMVAFGDAIPGAARSFGLAGDMLGLRRDTLRINTASAEVRATLEEQGQLTLAGSDDTVDGTVPPLRFSYSSALLGDDWRAASDEIYQSRTERIVASEPVSTLSAGARVLGIFPVFKEGRYSRSTDFVPDSNVTLPAYVHANDG
jgi:hypothetical protein